MLLQNAQGQTSPVHPLRCTWPPPFAGTVLPLENAPPQPLPLNQLSFKPQAQSCPFFKLTGEGGQGAARRPTTASQTPTAPVLP